MKKRILSLIICLCLVSAFVFVPSEKASADALTLSMVAGASLAIGQTFGITFSNDTWDSIGTENMMEGELSVYCGSRSIAEVFGAEAIRAITGKIVVGHVAYNAIINFLQFLNQKYNLGLNRVGMGFMFADNYGPLNDNAQQYLNGWSIVATPGPTYWSTTWLGPNGRTKSTSNNSVFVNSYDFDSVSYSTLAAGIQAIGVYSNSLGATTTRNHGTLAWSDIYPDPADRPSRVYGTSTGDIGSATVLNPGYGWAGTIPGYDDPDTNLDEIIGGIFEGVAEESLDVDAEVIPLVPPQPPIDPDTPLSDVPWHEVDDPLNDIDINIRDIADTFPDIIPTINQQTETLENIDTNITDIADTFPDIIPTINQQTETIENIEEALEDEEIDWPKFDLRGLFPFCIPFDIYAMLQALDASPVAPHVQIPFVIQSIGFSYTLDLNFAAFDSVAAVMRQMELIVYGIALAWATSKVIKW